MADRINSEDVMERDGSYDPLLRGRNIPKKKDSCCTVWRCSSMVGLVLGTVVGLSVGFVFGIPVGIAIGFLVGWIATFISLIPSLCCGRKVCRTKKCLLFWIVGIVSAGALAYIGYSLDGCLQMFTHDEYLALTSDYTLEARINLVIQTDNPNYIALNTGDCFVNLCETEDCTTDNALSSVNMQRLKIPMNTDSTINATLSFMVTDATTTYILECPTLLATDGSTASVPHYINMDIGVDIFGIEVYQFTTPALLFEIPCIPIDTSIHNTERSDDAVMVIPEGCASA